MVAVVLLQDAKHHRVSEMRALMIDNDGRLNILEQTNEKRSIVVLLVVRNHKTRTSASFLRGRWECIVRYFLAHDVSRSVIVRRGACNQCFPVVSEKWEGHNKSGIN